MSRNTELPPAEGYRCPATKALTSASFSRHAQIDGVPATGLRNFMAWVRRR